MKELTKRRITVVVVILGVATGFLAAFACGGDNEGLSRSTSPTAVLIESISPSSGTIGTEVTIRGSGFTSDNNDVAFTHEDISFEGRNTAYLNGLASPQGNTLRFALPEVLGACAFSQMKADEVCPSIGIPLPAGNLTIAVVNRNGSSNSVAFERQKSEIELAEEIIYSSPSFRELTEVLDDIVRRTGGSTAIDIGECDGKICIDVWIEKDVPELSQTIPAAIENFEVRIERRSGADSQSGS